MRLKYVIRGTALAGALYTTAAHAQGAPEAPVIDAAARRELLEQATAARRAGRHAEALDLALRAARLEMTPSVRLFVAQEYDAAGNAAEALGHAERCVREAERAATLPNREELVAACQALGRALRPHVGRVVVEVPRPTPPDLAVRVSEHPLHEAFYGVPYVVNPGRVVIDATAPGYAAVHRTVDVAPGSPVRVVLWTPAAPTDAAAASPAATPPPQPGAPPPPDAHAARRRPDVAARPGPAVGPWIVLGAGAAGLGAGLALWLLRDGAVATLERDFCAWDGHRSCVDTAEARAQLATANAFNVAAPIAVAVGGTAVAAAVVWLLAGRPSREARAMTSAGVMPVAGGVLVHVGGAL